MSDNLPVPVDQPQQQPPQTIGVRLPALLNEIGNMPLETWCSFTPHTTAERSQLYEALDGGGLQFSDFVGQPIPLVNVAMQAKDSLNLESGEVERQVITSLFLADGRVMSGSSVYVNRSVRNMLVSGWVPPFSPPLMVELVRIKTQRGHMLKLRVLASDVEVSEHINPDDPFDPPRKSKK